MATYTYPEFDLPEVNSFQRAALVELREACFDAIPYANWVQVFDGYRWHIIYSWQGVDDYIANSVPLAWE